MQRGQCWETCRDAIQCQTEKVTLVCICLTLPHASSHAHTHTRACLEPTQTQRHICVHAHTRSIRDPQFSSSLILLVSTVTAGWAEEFCDAPFQSCSQMNGLSVLCAVSPRPNCLAWTGTMGCGGIAVTVVGIWCSGYTKKYISSPPRAGSRFISRGVMLGPKRAAYWHLEQWLPVISNDKKSPQTLPSALTFWPVMLHCASIL